MIVLAGTIRIAPGRRADAEPHILRVVAASRAEPGCRAYSFSFDVEDDHLVRIFEVYDDEAALAAHRASPHFAMWRAVWADAGIGDRIMKEYRVSEARDI
jgi:quinol monooxygenase YgiN